MVRTCGTPTAKGNVGNLLQHFVLVQVLEVLRESYPDSRLDFVAPYAMAPLSRLPIPPACAKFEAVFEAAQSGRLASPYPRLVAALTGRKRRYPSSALLVSASWKDAHLHLADYSELVYAKIHDHFDSNLNAHHGRWTEAPEGWRQRFQACATCALFAELDPNLVLAGTTSRKPGSLDQAQLRRFLGWLTKDRPCIVQITTYSTNGVGKSASGASGSAAVVEATHDTSRKSGFDLLSCVNASGASRIPFSMVFSRSLPKSIGDRLDRALSIATGQLEAVIKDAKLKP